MVERIGLRLVGEERALPIVDEPEATGASFSYKEYNPAGYIGYSE